MRHAFQRKKYLQALEITSEQSSIMKQNSLQITSLGWTNHRVTKYGSMGLKMLHFHIAHYSLVHPSSIRAAKSR